MFGIKVVCINAESPLIGFAIDTDGDPGKQAEEWRVRLLDGSDAALEQFLVAVPAADRQTLEGLIKSARREDTYGKPKGAKKRLFRQLRDLLAG